MANLEKQVLHVTKAIEKQVDAAIETIDNLDLNDIENIRRQRIKELKEKEKKQLEWSVNGHGKYEELAEEKQFFSTIKKSENVVMHFYTNTNERCKIVDMHLKKLAPKHMETRFVCLNAEKCPFLAERLKIKVIPSIVSIRNGILVDKIIGFTDLGNRDDFSSETLEWRLARSEVIAYEGDLMVPPEERVEKVEKNRKIRSGIFNGDDDDLELDEAIKEGVTEGKSKEQGFKLTAEEEAELGLI